MSGRYCILTGDLFLSLVRNCLKGCPGQGKRYKSVKNRFLKFVLKTRFNRKDIANPAQAVIFTKKIMCRRAFKSQPHGCYQLVKSIIHARP